jgi:hypothetical protein
MNGSAAEVARLFGVNVPAPSNAPPEVYPGRPGMVAAGGELRSMVWGFPFAMKSKKTGALLKPKPVNNARTDKLDSFMWRFSFQERRCLIPVTEFAEAEGERGSMTRTWFSLPDQPIFAVAGIWRDTDEWGPALLDGDDRGLRTRCRCSRSDAGDPAARGLELLDGCTCRGGEGAVRAVRGRDGGQSHRRAVGSTLGLIGT